MSKTTVLESPLFKHSCLDQWFNVFVDVGFSRLYFTFNDEVCHCTYIFNHQVCTCIWMHSSLCEFLWTAHMIIWVLGNLHAKSPRVVLSTRDIWVLGSLHAKSPRVVHSTRDIWVLGSLHAKSPRVVRSTRGQMTNFSIFFFFSIFCLQSDFFSLIWPFSLLRECWSLCHLSDYISLSFCIPLNSLVLFIH